MDFNLRHNLVGKAENLPQKPSRTPGAEERHFETAYEELINQQVEKLVQAEEGVAYSLLPAAARRAKIELEVRNAFDLPELQSLIAEAMKIISHEGSSYLSEEAYSGLLRDIEHIRQKLGQLSAQQLEGNALKEAMAISAESSLALLKIGTAKYTEKLLQDSLSIFSLLSLVASENADYTYRFGLVAQESEKYPLAIDAYATVAQLAPEFVGSYLFAAQCYLAEGEHNRATEQLEKAAACTHIEPEWLELMVAMENLIASAKAVREF